MGGKTKAFLLGIAGATLAVYLDGGRQGEHAAPPSQHGPSAVNIPEARTAACDALELVSRISRNDVLSFLAGGAVASAVVLWLVRRYVRHELRPPKLIHGEQEDSPQARQLLLEVQLLLRDYWPHPLYECSGYLSTVWSALWVGAGLLKAHPGRLEELVLRDGGTVSLCWTDPPEHARHKLTVVLFPGVCNDSRTHFMAACAQHMRQEGFQVVTFNYRGIGGVPLTTERVGTFDSWEDVPEVVAHIESQCPGHDLFAMGFSMGACILLRHLGEAGMSTRFRAACAIAAPTDFVAVAKDLTSCASKYLINILMAQARKMLALKNGHWNNPKFKHIRSKFMRVLDWEGLDNLVIIPNHGYKSFEEYTERNSPRPVMRNIAVPTLILNSEDDPVIGANTICVDEIRKNPKVYLALTRRGGHLGWSSGGGDEGCWADHMAAHFLRSCETGRTVADIEIEDPNCQQNLVNMNRRLSQTSVPRRRRASVF